MKGPRDPVVHVRTTRPHAGEAMTDNRTIPALIVIGAALVAFVCSLAAFATHHGDVGLPLAALSAAGFVIGGVWLALEHVRVRHLEERWYADHPDVRRQRPNS
jgi:hypothetical protein